MPEGISAESVREQVNRILRSEGFVRSGRLRRFLQFTVDQALGGKSAELKEYLVGLEVFDKGTSFDPRIDTAVRVEARRLRTALLTYYATAGKSDPILIEYPKGSYAPVFQQQGAAAAQQREVERHTAGQPSRDRRKLWFGVALSFVVVVALGGIAEKTISTTRNAEPISSVAVLPFTDMSPEKDQEYFCDGLTEELIHALTKVEGLRVVARTSAFQFKQKPADIRLVGQLLKVGAVVEGSVRKDGHKVRITVQLNSTADGYHFWSETYEREERDVFAVQEEIAGSVVKTLRASLGDPRRRLVDVGSANIEAHNLYLKGRYFWARQTAADLRKSIECYEQAIALDPRYALAYVGVADIYTARAFDGDLTPTEGYVKKEAFLAKAFELDDRLPQAYTSRAMSKFQHDYDQTGAEQDFRRAIQLDQKDSYAREQFALALICWRRFDEARRELERAQEVDPLSVTISHKFAVVSYFARQYDRAIEEATRSLDLDAPYYRIQQVRGAAYQQKGMYDQALTDFEKAVQVSGGRSQPLGHLGYLYAVTGKRAEAENVLARLQEGSGHQSPVPLARIYLGLGQTSRALDLLEKAYESREGMLMFLSADPTYDSLQGFSRFQNLLKKMGLPPRQ